MWALGFVFFFLLIASLWKKFVGQGPFELLVSKAIKVILISLAHVSVARHLPQPEHLFQGKEKIAQLGHPQNDRQEIGRAHV